MHHFGFLNSKCALPAAASPELAARGLEQWLEAAGEAARSTDASNDLLRFAEQAADDPLGRRVLESIFGNSPFLTSVIVTDPHFTRGLLNAGPRATFDRIIGDLRIARRQSMSDESLARLLRVARKRVALTVALADIANAWSLPEITGALTEFAEQALSIAARHVLREAAGRGAFKLKWPDDPERDSGLIIIGMGKLGGDELNYSSDIDLIVLYDPDRVESADPDGLQAQFVRLTRNLVRLLEQRTVDGYVFRTDLRLRPDPGVTPIALSVLAAETYYESLGQNWERAAMIKARVVAGDRDAGAAYLKRLTPYVWRKNLDFAAIQDIHSIKRQIHVHKGGAKIAVAGHNIKIGRGGIREIEFFAQTQQLIWGGRQPNLRTTSTCRALTALAENSHSAEQAVRELMAAYEFLRRVEHRLQMINDEQTQKLPADAVGLQKLAIFLGYDGANAFSAELIGHLTRVQDHYAKLFEHAPPLGADEDVEGAGSLVFTGVEADPETLATIKALGYENPERVHAAVRAWHHGRYRATRSTRAREILTELMPALLKAIGATPAPDIAFMRFDEFLAGLPAGVQLFSMFHSNPQLLGLVAEIMGKAPRLAHHLSRRPAILDSVLAADFFDPLPDAAALLADFEGVVALSEHFEQALDASRRWNNDRRFQVGLQCLRGLIAPGDAGKVFSRIAETALAGLYPIVEEDFARGHGHIAGSRMAVVALGKLGSREMTASSDLDLIFVYDLPGGDVAKTSDGKRPLDAPKYFARLSQRLINAITAPTAEGHLYEVDMRLRPSGTKGPIASSLDAFKQYHSDTAWTWERMALTRARPLIGPPDLCERIVAAIRATLMAPRNPDSLLRDIADMRARLDADRPADCIWALKHMRGGIVDVEFFAQYLTLRYAPAHPEILGHDTRGTLAALVAARLLDADTGRRLTVGWDLWLGLQSLLALTIEGELTRDREDEISRALKQDLVRCGGADDFAALERKIRDTADQVYRVFRTMIEEPAAALPSAAPSN
ncbi:MAG: bifunctional [glutamine synthetase] adenylyltransferase/[glutamine synthetase]-adenylyl-L-tyrosine phosphorylase [Rhodospirillales bacterium]|nr:bifunctional [glutamine synthetase] adenylyltransferase/[glutamine synthetase]-adenylyl-L-tyrosine phosphorylase [Rhodospirillales bacterium]